MRDQYFPYAPEEWPKVDNPRLLMEKDAKRKVVTITFNNPEKKNALTLEDMDDLGRLVRQHEDDDEVKVIIFKGAGDCFGTGAHVGDLGRHVGFTEKEPRPPLRRRFYREHYMYGPNIYMQIILNCLKVTISQVHGYCYGVHLGIAMVSDLTVCSEDALFGHPALSYIGPTEEIVCPGIEIMGLKKMKEMMYTRRPITAEEALQCGLVTRVVPRDKLEETVNEMAQVVATLSIDHIMAGKAVVEAMLHMRGVYGGLAVTAMAHNMATWVHWEPDEFNLFKQRRDKGITEAIRAREEMVPPAYRLSRKKEGK